MSLTPSAPLTPSYDAIRNPRPFIVQRRGGGSYLGAGRYSDDPITGETFIGTLTPNFRRIDPSQETAAGQTAVTKWLFVFEGVDLDIAARDCLVEAESDGLGGYQPKEGGSTFVALNVRPYSYTTQVDAEAFK